LTKPKIEECADKCGLFAVIYDVLIQLEPANISNLNVSKIDATDLKTFLETS